MLASTVLRLRFGFVYFLDEKCRSVVAYTLVSGNSWTNGEFAVDECLILIRYMLEAVDSLKVFSDNDF